MTPEEIARIADTCSREFHGGTICESCFRAALAASEQRAEREAAEHRAWKYDAAMWKEHAEASERALKIEEQEADALERALERANSILEDGIALWGPTVQTSIGRQWIGRAAAALASPRSQT
jgi:hypothetical protein